MKYTGNAYSLYIHGIAATNSLVAGFSVFHQTFVMLFYLYQNMIQVHSCVRTTEASFSFLSLDCKTNTYFSTTNDNLQRIKDILADTSLKSK